MELTKAALNANSAKGVKAACGLMDLFIAEVSAVSGKSMAVSQATQLIAAAQHIKATLGCSS